MEKKKRGRPKGGGGSAGRPKGSNSTVIIDPVISPYKISVDPECYNVTDEVDPEGEGVTIKKSYGYFSSLGYALKKIVSLKLPKNKKYSLKEYIEEYDASLKSFQQIFEKYEV